MKVELLNKDMCKNFFKNWGEFSCICYNTDKKYAERVGKSCLKSGHFSGSRAEFFKFEITGLSRACIDQLVRHEEGVVKNVMSGRYVDFSHFEYYTPQIIKKDEVLSKLYHDAMKNAQISYGAIVSALERRHGITGEKAFEVARGVSPMNHKSALVIAFNLEGLINLCHKRLCSCSQGEINELTKKIREIIVEEIPELNSYLVPICKYLNACPESKDRSCGLFPVFEEDKL